MLTDHIDLIEFMQRHHLIKHLIYLFFNPVTAIFYIIFTNSKYLNLK